VAQRAVSRHKPVSQHDPVTTGLLDRFRAYPFVLCQHLIMYPSFAYHHTRELHTDILCRDIPPSSHHDHLPFVVSGSPLFSVTSTDHRGLHAHARLFIVHHPQNSIDSGSFKCPPTDSGFASRSRADEVFPLLRVWKSLTENAQCFSGETVT